MNTIKKISEKDLKGASFKERLLLGMKLSWENLLEEKRKSGEKLVVLRNGKIVHISAEEF